MNIISINMRAIAVALLCIASFAFAVSPASADHGDEAEVTTHASTVHEHDASSAVEVTVTSSPVVVVLDVVRLQKLLNALEQLVELLKQKAQLEHDAIPHEHEEGEHHDEEDNDEDHA